MKKKINYLVMFTCQLIGVLLAIASFIWSGVFLLLALFLHYLKMNLSAKLLFKWALSLDQTANAFLNGNEDQTVSGRLGRRVLTKKATKAELWLCKVLSEIDPTTNRHCIDSIEYDEVRI